MNQAVFQSVKPAKTLIPSSISTSSGMVLSRRLQEFRPESQNEFSFSTNNEIVFDINSPAEFLLNGSSYHRFDLTTFVNGSAGKINYPNRYLSEGGGHIFYRDIVLETQNGVQIERCSRYNKAYHAQSSMYFSREHVDSCLSREGDSSECILDNNNQEFSGLNRLSGSISILVNNTGAVTGVGSKFTSELVKGDLIYIAVEGGFSVWGLVESIASDTSMNISKYDDVTGFDLSASDPAPFYKMRLNNNIFENEDAKSNNLNRAIRNIAATQTSDNKYQITMQLNLNFFKSIEAFPLFLLKGGLRLRLILEQPEYVLCFPSQLENSLPVITSVDYKITNPVMVCDMMTPHPTLAQSYKDMYDRDGLHYPLLNYNYELYSGNQNTISQNIKVSKRSIKFILFKIQDKRSETITAKNVNSGKNTLSCDSIAQGLKAKLKRYELSIGSLRFPLQKPVDLENDVSNSEPLIELNRIKQDTGSFISHKRWKAIDFQDRVNRLREFESTDKPDAQRLVLGADMSRDNTPFSGISSDYNMIKVDMEFSDSYKIFDTVGDSTGVVSDRYIHFFIYYDSLVTLNRDNGLVVLQ